MPYLIFFLLFTMTSLHAAALKSTSEAHVLRLTPDEDPRVALMNYIKENKIAAAAIVSAVGSLKVTSLRYANQNKTTTLEGFREIVSLTGTLSHEHGAHIHLSVSDSQGATLGGHLQEGSKVYTTLEVVLLSFPDLIFERRPDHKTGFLELSVKKR